MGTILSMEGVGPFQKGVYDFLRKVPQIGEVKLVTFSIVHVREETKTALFGGDGAFP